LKELPKMKGNNWVTTADFEFFMEKKIFFYQNLCTLLISGTNS
jgi:hypothetical protein